MNTSQLEYGEKQLQKYCKKFNLTTKQMIRVLSLVNELCKFYEWINADEFLCIKINQAEEGLRNDTNRNS